MEYPGLRTLLVFFCFLVIVILMLTGCSSEYDLCIEREKEEFRQSSPNASYGQLTSKQQQFEMACSSFKSK